MVQLNKIQGILIMFGALAGIMVDGIIAIIIGITLGYLIGRVMK